MAGCFFPTINPTAMPRELPCVKSQLQESTDHWKRARPVLLIRQSWRRSIISDLT